MSQRDGHVRVLPLHVANKIAAGEVVERPASVIKELLENAIDAGARSIRVTITQGGRKLAAVQDDGCGMTRDDALLSLERQATSKILDVEDIERIDTLGFRGEAIPSIASVSRFSLTTRRHDSDEGTFIQVNAGTIAEVRAAGCPPGTLVEVRDLFCNVPARRKFLRAYATEEAHVKSIFTVHALAHPAIGFTLVVDGRETLRLAPAGCLRDRVHELFGDDFLANSLPVDGEADGVRVSGFIERPNLTNPTRRDQHVFVNGRPATAPSIAYALREAYPRRQGDVRPAAILFIDLPSGMVDVNVHPTKREVRFRNNPAVREAITTSIEAALAVRTAAPSPAAPSASAPVVPAPAVAAPATAVPSPVAEKPECPPASKPMTTPTPTPPAPAPAPAPAPIQTEISLETSSDGTSAKPWRWFRYLAQSESGYLLIETDAGIVTINPIAARERIAYERMLLPGISQPLLVPETVQLSPTDHARILGAAEMLRKVGFQIEDFGRNVLKIDAVPQLLGTLSAANVLATVAHDLSEGGARRGGLRWREELIAKAMARSFAGASIKLDESGATKLVEELCATKMPYICPRGKPVMIFTSTRELNRKFDRV